MNGVSAEEKRAILSPIGQCPNGPGCRHPACRIEGCKASVLAHLQAQVAALTDHDEDIEDLLYAITNCCIALGRAERVLRTGDIDAGRDIVRSAAADLAGMV